MRLIQADREAIQRVVLEHAFGKRAKEIEKAERELAGEVYAQIVGPYRRKLSALPKEWTRIYERISFRAGACYFSLKLGRPHLFPYRDSLTLLEAPELLAKVERLEQDKEKLKQEREERRGEVWSLLAGIGTFAKLQAVWPEAVKLLPKDFTTGRNLPVVVDVQAINEKLGLGASAS